MVLRHLFTHWLRSTASQQVREKVVEAAQEKLSEQAEAVSSDEPLPCDIGVVFALAEEAGGLEDKLEGMLTVRGHEIVVRYGAIKGRRVAIVRSGAGRTAAAAATEALIDGHQPQWIIAAGFAGGLAPELSRGDVLLVDHLVDRAGNQMSIDLKVDPAALDEQPGVHLGRLLTVDKVVRLPDEKRALGREHDALAVDMETFAVAEVCRRRKVRLMAARAISDTVDDELPADVEHLLTQKTTAARLGAAAGAVFRRPSSAKDMLKLKENALLASDKLAKFLVGMIEQLSSP